MPEIESEDGKIYLVNFLLKCQGKDLQKVMQMLKDKGVEPWQNLQ